LKSHGSGFFIKLDRFFWLFLIALLVLFVAGVAVVIGFNKLQDQLETIKTIVDKTPQAVGAVASQENLLVQGRLVNWHYHLTASSQSELIELIQQMQLPIDNESENFFVFYVPKEKSDEFKNRMSGMSGLVKEYGDFDVSFVGESIQASVYLE
jgi:hypothetical protein